MSRELELLERLVAFHTVSGRSNLDLIDWAENLLQEAGFRTTRIPAADRGKAGLHAIMGPSRDGGVCLSAHTDVVTTTGQTWRRDPFILTRDGAWVYGRGTTDMKGFVACALAMAERADPAKLRRPVSIVLSYDEEIGCVGLREMLPHLQKVLGKPEAVVVGEPTSMQIATGHKGKAAYKVTCKGEAGHSAMAPHYVNAIHVAARFVDEIRAVQSTLENGPQDPAFDIPYSTLHIGRIEGGRALNIVPDLVTLEMEVRHVAQAPIDELTAAIHQAALRTCDSENCPGAITIEPTVSYPALDHDPQSATVELLRKVTDGSTTTKVAFGTEAGLFASLGLNTVVIGPGDMARHGHKPDEAIEIRQLEACTAMMNNMLTHLEV